MSEQKELIGQVEIPNQRSHIFGNIQTLCDFVVTFRIENFTVRTGDLNGKIVHELVYYPVNN